MNTPLQSFRPLPALLLLLLFAILLPRAVRAQGADQVGRAIVQTCGNSVDPRTEGVLAGTVTDSITGVALPNARVSIVFQVGDNPTASKTEVNTDKKGFYAFCGVPGNTLLLLSANLRVTSAPRSVIVEPGTLQVEKMVLSVSDPKQPGSIVGRVVDKASRAPVDGATVRIEELKAETLTNERGYFSFGERPFGTYSLQVEHIGYADADVPIHVAGALTQVVEVDLVTAPIEIPGLAVTITAPRVHRDIEGLIHRMNMGFGTFITRETLEKRPEARLGDFLREVPGILVFAPGTGQAASLEVRGKSCDPDVYLDGLHVPLDPSVGVNEFRGQEFEAVEVYEGSQTPAEYLRAGGGYPCAAILLWTHWGR
jgi:hypothetical protein